MCLKYLKKKKSQKTTIIEVKKKIYCYACNKLCYTSNLYFVNDILKGLCEKCYLELISFNL